MASVNAGGISNSGGTAQVFVVNSTINDNQATQDGGALWNCSQCSATILASTVSNNTTFGDGAIYNAGGDLRIATSTLNNNITDGTGGALFNTGGNVTITNSTINDNQSTTGAGGGIANTTGGTMTLVGSTVNANEAGAQGGGVSTDGSSVLTLTNSTVSGNYTVWFGGGIYVEAGSTVNLRSATIASNVADGDGNGSGSGGGIASNGTTNFRNTLFGLNGRGLFGGTPDDCFGTITSQRYNLIQTTTNCTIVADDGSNLKNVNPLLAALANNGGPTRTRALQINSPAINTGNPAGCTDQSNLVLTGDQRGAARTGRCDIGAYEYQGCMLTGDLNDDRAVTVADIILAANDWNASPANYDPMTDLNGNGRNDAADIMIVSSQFGQSCP